MAKIEDFVSSLRPFSPAPEQPVSSGTSSSSSTGSSSSGERSYRNPFYDSSKPISSLNSPQATNPFTPPKQSFTSSTQNYGANLAAAEAALEQARNNMYGATDPFTESELRKEFEAAQAKYDEAKRLAQENAHRFMQQAAKDIAEQQGLPDISNLSQQSIAQGPQPMQELIPGRGQKPVYDNALSRTGKWLGESVKAGGLNSLGGAVGTTRVAQEATEDAQIARNFDSATEAAWSLAKEYASQLSDPETAEERNDAIFRFETELKGFCDALGDGVYEQVLANAKKAAEEIIKPETDLDELYNNFNSGVSVDETNFQKATKATSELANELISKAGEHESSAKEIIGDTKLGNFLTDSTVNLVQMAIDGAVGTFAAGTLDINPWLKKAMKENAALAFMLDRAFGNKAQQVEAEGGTFAQQVVTAGLSAGVEGLTEKLSSGMKLFYGDGLSDNITEEIIRRFVTDDTGRAILVFLANGVGEGIEEILSAAAEPAIDAVYKGSDYAKQSYLTKEGIKDLAANAGYDALVGFFLGEFGGTIEAATGGITETVENMATTDEVQNALIDSGMSKKAAQNVAPTVVQALNGAELGKKQSKAINNPIIQSLYGEQIDAAKAAAQNATAASGTAPAPTPGQAQAEGRTAPAQAAIETPQAFGINAAAEVASTPIETVTEEMPTPEAAQPTVEAQPAQVATETTATANPLQSRVEAILNSGKVTNSQAEEIINNPELRAEFEAKTGNPLVGTKSEQRNQIKAAAEIASQPAQTGTTESAPQPETAQSEESATTPEETQESPEASSVELNSESETASGTEAENNAEAAVEETEQVAEEVPDYKPGDGEYKGYEVRERTTSDDKATYSIYDPSGKYVDTIFQSSDPNVNMSESVMQRINDDIAQRSAATQAETAPAAEQTANVKTQPNAPYVPVTGKPSSNAPKASQTSTNSMRATAEANNSEQETLYYTPISEQESLNNAMNRVAADQVGEMNNLMNKEAWTGEDIDTAYTIYGKLKYDSVKTGDSTAADAWAKIVQTHGTRAGQALQAMSKWARTGAAATMDIDAEIDASESLTPEQKTEIKNAVAKFMESYDSIEDGDIDAVRKLILEQNEYRKTGTFWNKNFERLLNKETDFNWLKEYAIRQARNIPADYTVRPSLGQQLKTWQVNAQLTRVGTFFRNLGGNASFGIVDTFAQDAFGYAIDSAVAKITGKKEVGFDRAWLSEKARDAASNAMRRSILEVAGDVDMTGNANAYGTTANRTNKMTGNQVQRAMSRWEQLLGYSLTTSDRFFRGEIEQSITESLMEEGMEEAEAKQLAKQVADYRLFQNNGRAAQVSRMAHDLLNRIWSVGNEETGRFGLGDLLNPYPGVPANLAVKALEYSPANIVNGGYEIVKLLIDAKAGKAVSGQQMTAVMDIARGMTGTAVVALFSALAKSGLFKNSDDEDDYDVMAENTAQNLSGIQWNLSATKRAMEGEAADWKDGDTLMKVSWLEPLNAFMAIGSLIANSDEDKDIEELAKLYFEGAVNAAMDMPVLENIQNAYNTFRYSTADDMVQQFLEAGAQLLGDAAGGMIPAPFSQTARVADDYVRDTKGDTKTQTSINALMNSLPVLRNMLPVKTDNFGNPRLNEPDMYNRFMNSFVRPGAVSTFMETEVQDEIRDLYEVTGDVALFPDRSGPKKITNGDETYSLTADESRAYHEFAGQKSEEYVNALLSSDYYQNLTDVQKTAAIKEVYSLAKDLAKADYLKGKTEDYSNSGTNLLNGVNKSGTSNDKTALNENNVADYVSYMQSFNDAVKSNDYTKIDEVIKQYGRLNKNLQTVISEQATNYDNLREYSKLGLGSETFFEVRETRKEARDTLDENVDTATRTRFLGLAMADIPEAQKKAIIENVDDYIGSNGKAAYSALSKHGLNTADVYTFFDTALNCKSWKDTGAAIDAGGTLSADATAFALMNTPGLTDEQRSQIFSDIKHQVSNKYNDWKNYTYASEINYIFNDPRNKATYSVPSTASASTDTGKQKVNPFQSGITAKTGREKANALFGSVRMP